MASVNWLKCTTSTASAMYQHMDRHGDRDVKYSNPHVNPELSQYNYFATPKGLFTWDNRNRMPNMMEKLKRRIRQIDEEIPPKRVRSDRKTVIAFEAPIPPGLSQEQEAQYVMIVFNSIADMCGGTKNVSAAYVHVDEQHKYVDAMTKEVKTSLKHIHMLGLAYTPEHGINAKHFETKARLSQLNNTINEKAKALGITFNTGQGKNAFDINNLKIASQREELKALEEQVQLFKEKVQTLKEKVKTLDETIEYKQDALLDVCDDLERLVDMYFDLSKANRALFRQMAGVEHYQMAELRQELDFDRGL